jgi:thiamine biosynthesis lipoprotein
MDGNPGLRLAAQAMGTRFELLLVGEEEPGLRAAGEAALEEIETLHRLLNLFDKTSFLSHLNRSAQAGPVRIDADLAELLELCFEVHEVSGGAFDPSVGPLMQCWGFHGSSPSVPSPEERERQLAKVGFEQLDYRRESRELRFLRPGMRLDFGAVAKGLALDRVRGILAEAGVRDALVHGGTSTIMAMGSAPGARGWKVAIQDPLGDDAILDQILLEDGALSVSAPHGRSFEAQGRRVGHVMDPASGAPPEDCPLLCAVSCSSAALADAWSTALLAAGSARFSTLVARARERWPQVTALLCGAGPDGRTRSVEGSSPGAFVDSCAPNAREEGDCDA